MKKARKGDTAEADVLTADEVAGWLRIPKSMLYELCQEGQIPATKIGRHWRFDRAIVENCLREECPAPEGLGIDEEHEHGALTPLKNEGAPMKEVAT